MKVYNVVHKIVNLGVLSSLYDEKMCVNIYADRRKIRIF